MPAILLVTEDSCKHGVELGKIDVDVGRGGWKLKREGTGKGTASVGKHDRSMSNLRPSLLAASKLEARAVLHLVVPIPILSR